LEEKHMFCEGTLFPIDIDINPSITLFNIPNADPVMISFNLGNLFPADGYCSFAAGGGVYINSSENITLYAVDYYLRDGHQEHQYVRFQEFKPVSPHIVENVEQSWVQPIWKREQTLQFSPGTSSFVIDYDDHEHRNYHNYKSIKRWLETDSDDGSFNDHITGASWLIPDGYQYLFYEHAYQRGQYFPLIGTGQWVSSTLDIDFGVSSSGASTHSHSGPQPISGQEAFLPITSLSKI
jgi:hypothetical protein